MARFSAASSAAASSTVGFLIAFFLALLTSLRTVPWSLPARFSISSYENLGGVDGWSPLFRNDRTRNVSVNATWIKGAHEMRFGLDVVRLELTHWQPELGNHRGNFDFTGDADEMAALPEARIGSMRSCARPSYAGSRRARPRA